MDGKNLKYDNFLLSQKHTNFKKNYFKKEEEKPKKTRNLVEFLQVYRVDVV